MTTGQAAEQEPIESHAIHSGRLLKHAREQLAREDRLQASEKAWGAVAHALQRVAKERGRRQSSHRDLSNLIEELDRERPRQRFRLLWWRAQSAHQNFYRDTMSLSEIEAVIEAAEELVRKLGRLHPVEK